MKKKKLRIQYQHVSNRDYQRRLNEVFDLIFAKIEEMKRKEKSTLDRSILDDYTVFKCNHG